jgi:hypothetical protein
MSPRVYSGSGHYIGTVSLVGGVDWKAKHRLQRRLSAAGVDRGRWQSLCRSYRRCTLGVAGVITSARADSSYVL